MSIAQQIAAKRAELAIFVTESAQAVLAENMSDAERGIVALDLLKLMVASGLKAAPAAPMIDVTPEKPKEISAPVAAAPAAPAKVQAPEVAAPAPARKGRVRSFTDEQLLAAIDELGHDNKAIASRFSMHSSFINLHRRRLGVPRPKGRGRERKAVPARGTGVDWTTENKAKLLVMATRSPRPSNTEIAVAFGTSPSAIQTALSRFGITKGQSGRSAGTLKDLSGLKQRSCMSCEQPCLSEGSHNRRCNKCKGNDHQVAA